ncbi:MAG: hypothetical protein B7C24_04540 [Bacteroidetes bacterium 4572_77]|nr:MAG: hypothetical protein B7C24_04540 [Bacteroidetes bacterium 4572_77]
MIEIIGYLGSFFVAAAMLFNSIVRLRWLSLTGSTLFAIYGFSIGAYPVGAVNAFIMVTNIIHLRKLYSKKENFKALEVNTTNKYLLDFLSFHAKDIARFFPDFEGPKSYNISLLVLRDMQVAGVFLAQTKGKDLVIQLDYVTPQYRDFKLGEYIYNEFQSEFAPKGYTRFVSGSYSPKNDRYLKKLGFKEENQDQKLIFVKSIS